MRIVLASGSPRRRQLLEQMGLDFDVVVSDADETVEGAPHEQVAALARRKAEAVAALLAAENNAAGVQAMDTQATRAGAAGNAQDTLIIAADTLVAVESRGRNGAYILGKPADAQDAFDMLSALQGRKHTVYTGVALLRLRGQTGVWISDDLTVFVDAAYVYFRSLSKREIHAYIATGEPFDKAGAYGIQEKGALLVERVEGDFYTVMGLPVSKLCVQLEEMGVDVWGQG